MRVNGQDYRSIWLKPDDPAIVQAIDQRALPHRFAVMDLANWRDGEFAIKDMVVRGAPLIGATAAWSLYLATREAADKGAGQDFLMDVASALIATRPTAVNLAWAVNRVLQALANSGDPQRTIAAARQEAEAICSEDIAIRRRV